MKLKWEKKWSSDGVIHMLIDVDTNATLMIAAGASYRDPHVLLDLRVSPPKLLAIRPSITDVLLLGEKIARGIDQEAPTK